MGCGLGCSLKKSSATLLHLHPMEDYDSVVTEFSKLIHEFEEVISAKETLARQVQTLQEDNSALKAQVANLAHELVVVQSTSLDHHRKEISRYRSQLCALLKNHVDGSDGDSMDGIIKSLEELVGGMEGRIKRQSDLEGILKGTCKDLEKRNSQVREEMMAAKSEYENGLLEEKARSSMKMKQMREEMQKLEAAVNTKGRADGLSFLFVTVFFMIISLLWLRYVEGR